MAWEGYVTHGAILFGFKRETEQIWSPTYNTFITSLRKQVLNYECFSIELVLLLLECLRIYSSCFRYKFSQYFAIKQNCSAQ